MAAQMPKEFTYTGTKPWDRKKEREIQLKEDPEVVYETFRDEQPDKYMFYTTNPDELRKNVNKTYKNDPETIICYKWDTDEGTIMLYPTSGICVIHGDEEKKKNFLVSFDKQLKQDPGDKSADGQKKAGGKKK